jgi:hypothetical protein
MPAAAATSSSSRRPTTRPAASSANAPTSGAVNADDDATQGEWLFKHNDLVLGPVTAIILVEKIKKGELDGDTPVARDGDAFRPMKLVRLFREAWQATVEERRNALEERAWQGAVKRAKVGRALLLCASFAVPAAGAGMASRHMMTIRPWDDTPLWIAKVPPLVDLPQKPPELKKTEPPVTTASSTQSAGDDDESKAVDPDKPKKPKTTKPGGDDNAASGSGTGSEGPGTPTDPTLPSSVDTLTNAQAVAPLKEIQGDLKACFKAEMDSNPDMPPQVSLSYTITETGKATNIELDARELRDRPVVACVQKAVGTLRWPRFSGERKNVSVPFKLGKPKAAGGK